MSRYAGKTHQILKMSKDSVAGCLREKQYWYVKIFSKGHPAHRIIMSLHGHKIGGLVVDHIDGNPCNNLLCNLRVGSVRLNSQNKIMRRTNTSGVTGVKWDCKWDRSNTWYSTYATAFWQGMDGKQKCKMFSVPKYGLLPAFKMACDYRQEQILLLNSLGEAYTDRHVLL